MVLVISRIIGEIARQGFPCLFHLLTGLYCPGCGGTRAFRALLAGNLLLSIRYHPLVAYMAVVLTAELVSFAVSRAAKNPRYYLGHEKLLVYTGAAIALVNWVYKNYMLVVRGVDLLPCGRADPYEYSRSRKRTGIAPASKPASEPKEASGLGQLQLLVQLFLEPVDELINLRSGHRIAERLIVAGQSVEKEKCKGDGYGA